MNFVDTHCHIHSQNYKLDARKEVQLAEASGVTKIIVVGEGIDDCLDGVEFAKRNGVFISVGLHPHQAETRIDELEEIASLLDDKTNRIVAIGECGLDYYYLHSPKSIQKKVFLSQIELAKNFDLPLIFHIRGSKEDPEDAFRDFFEITNLQNNLRGVVHSFSGNIQLAEAVINRNFYIGLNGLITFIDDKATEEMIEKLPLERILLETDSPYLTPVPFRGIINTPQYVVEVGKHLAEAKGESLGKIADVTTINASELFKI